MAQAMEQVRDELGPDAIIISTLRAKRGRGVEVRAAVERSAALPLSAPADETSKMPLPNGFKSSGAQSDALSAITSDHVKKLLQFHGIAPKLGNALLTVSAAIDAPNAKESLERAIELRFPFETLRPAPIRPIMLIGGPGVGKTVTAAKLAARAVIAGARPRLITTDTLRSGAVEQLRSLARKMGQSATVAEEPDRLQSLIEPSKRPMKTPRPAFIDTPAINALAQNELDDVKRFLKSGNIEPIAVIAAGSTSADLTETLRAFMPLGVKRIIVTRLDATRRIGSVLNAVDQTKLGLSLASDSPYIGEELEPFTPQTIAHRLFVVPTQTEFQQANKVSRAGKKRTQAL